MLMQFLRGFGRVLGLDVASDVPTLSMLQEGLLNVGDSMGHVQDLLVRMLSLAVCDPGLPPGHKVRREGGRGGMGVWGIERVWWDGYKTSFVKH